MISIMNHNTKYDAYKFSKYLASVSSNADNVTQYIEKYVTLCAKEGVDVLVALAQVMVETNNFDFSTETKKIRNNTRFNNFGGIRNNNRYISFSTETDGITAHVQMLKGYASKEAPNGNKTAEYTILEENGLIGTVPYVTGLSGSWVVPGYNTSKYPDLASATENKDTYGCYIELKYNEIVEFMNSVKDDDVNDSNTDTVNNVISSTTEVLPEKVDTNTIAVNEVVSSTTTEVLPEKVDTNTTAVNEVVSSTTTEVLPEKVDASISKVSIKDLQTKSSDIKNTKTEVPSVKPSYETYRVLCGSFKEERRAHVIANKMHSKKLNASVVSENGVYKVYSGSFGDKENATKQLRAVLSRGISCSIVKVVTL